VSAAPATRRIGGRAGELTLVVLAQLAVFAPVAWLRLLDPDEGTYAEAAKLVTQGRLPYRDFFWPQTPVLPYVYGAWLWLAGNSWLAVRALTCALLVGTGTLLFVLVRRRASRAVAWALLLAFAGNALVFSYLSVGKTYTLATLLLLGALAVAERAERDRDWVIAGMLLGLAVATRLPAATATVGLAYLAAVRAGPTLRRLALGGAGLLAGLAPLFAMLALWPHAVLFDNLGYHATKTSAGLVGNGHEKLGVLANMVGYGLSEGHTGPQLLVLVVASACCLAAALVRRRPPPAALVVAAALVAGGFVPTPTYLQYQALAVPFVLLAVAQTLGELRLDRRVALAGAVVLGAYLALAVAPARLYLFGSRTGSIARANAVSRALDARTHPGDVVLSLWPGYVFPTHAEVWPGLENLAAPAAGLYIDARTARADRLATIPALLRGLHGKERPRAVVVRAWSWVPPGLDEATVERLGYRRVETSAAVPIFVR
jgi:hypothetical protein